MQDGKHVILCVDDDPDILECLQLVLEQNDYVVETAGSAEDAFKQYQQSRPDLIIADLMMEEIDAGTSFVTRLKAEGNTAPVYILSSIGDNLNLNVNFSELGLSGVFQKPINNDTLLLVLKSKLK